jgi:hypothetical protein
VNKGITELFTVIVIVAILAHSPTAGVNVYVVVAVLFKAGDHVPEIPFKEVVGNGDNVSPEHIAGTWVKEGIPRLLTVMVIVAVIAHSPAAGVNVYVVVAVLFKAGDHEPVIPLFEVMGNGDSRSPEHMAAICVNVGVVLAFTVMVIFVTVAHWPAAGVKVYVVVVVLSNAGDHVPLMPLFEIAGNGAKADPAQIAATCVNIGVTFVFTTMVMEVVVAH